MAHSFTTPGTGVQPKSPALPQAEEQRIPHRFTPKFWLRSHPLRWQIVGDEFLPLLGTLKHDLGVNGCDKRGNMDITRMESAKREWVEIPWDAIEGGYIRAWPAQGGDYHCTKWETPRWRGDKILESRIDTNGYHDFLREMIAKGFIPLPDPDDLEQVLVDQQEKEVERLAKETHKPGVMEAYTASKDKLERMRKAVATLRNPPKKGKG